MPKQWFDTDATAQQRPGITVEAMVKLLSPDNLTLLQTIGGDNPASVNELAELTGRKSSNLTRTLKRFEQAGIITHSAWRRQNTKAITASTKGSDGN